MLLTIEIRIEQAPDCENVINLATNNQIVNEIISLFKLKLTSLD